MFPSQSPPYLDHANVFSADSTADLLEHTGINNHPIDLVDFKSSAGAPILPIRKKDGSFQLCV